MKQCCAKSLAGTQCDTMHTDERNIMATCRAGVKDSGRHVLQEDMPSPEFFSLCALTCSKMSSHSYTSAPCISNSKSRIHVILAFISDRHVKSHVISLSISRNHRSELCHGTCFQMAYLLDVTFPNRYSGRIQGVGSNRLL